MKKFILLTAFSSSFLFLLNSSFASKYKCAFKKPFIMGASISAGYGGYGELAKIITRYIISDQPQKYYGDNKSPVVRISEKYFDFPNITNISEIVTSTKIEAMPYRSFAHRQFDAALLDSKLRASMEDSTLLASLDGFYWPAAFSANNPDLCEEAISGLQRIIDYGITYNKPIVLGNIPQHDPKKIDYLLKWLNSGLPLHPQRPCLKAINTALATYCTTANQCYLVDLHAAVEKMNNDEVIEFEGSLNDIRDDFTLDGLHPSDKGIRYLMYQIEESMKDNLPHCAN